MTSHRAFCAASAPTAQRSWSEWSASRHPRCGCPSRDQRDRPPAPPAPPLLALLRLEQLVRSTFVDARGEECLCEIKFCFTFEEVERFFRILLNATIVAPGLTTTSNKKLLVAPGTATRSKDATLLSFLFFSPLSQELLATGRHRFCSRETSSKESQDSSTIPRDVFVQLTLKSL